MNRNEYLYPRDAWISDRNNLFISGLRISELWDCYDYFICRIDPYDAKVTEAWLKEDLLMFEAAQKLRFTKMQLLAGLLTGMVMRKICCQGSL